MTDNIAIKITADVVDLQTKFAVARAESSALSSELNNLAKQAAGMGPPTENLQANLQQVAAQSLQAKAKLADLKDQMSAGSAKTSEFTSFLGDARGVLASFGLALGVGELVEFGKRVFENAEQIYHEAEVLGMTTTNLQLFTESAKLAGVATDSVDTAIRKFNISQGQAASGTGLQAKAFNDLGVSAKLPADQALPAVARALLSITDVARRSRDEVALFGKAGEEMNPALEQWARGTDALNAELSAQGLILSNETVKGAHDAKVAMDKTWDQVDVAWTPAIVGLSHVIQGLGIGLNYLTNIKWSSIVNGMAQIGAAQMGGYGGDIIPGQGTKPTFERAKPYVIPQGPQKQPKSNFHDDADGKKQAEQARQIADDKAKAYEQGNLRHISSEEQTNSALLSMGSETLDAWQAQAIKLEDDRYKAAVDGIAAREKADAGDKVKLAADIAEGTQLYQEHQDKLTSIHLEYLQKKKVQDAADFAEFQASEDAKLAAAVQGYDQQYRAGEISALQRRDLEVAFTNQVEAEILKRFDAEHAGLTAGTAAYETAMKERDGILQKFGKQVVAEDKTYADLDAASWNTANKTILQSESSMITDFLSGRANLSQSLLQITSQLIAREIANDVGYWTERALLSAEGVGKEKATEQGGLLVKLFGDQVATSSVVQSQTAQTGAVVAGVKAREAVQASGSTSAGAAQVAAGSVSILNSAKVAAAGTYADLSPVMGPLAALPAAAVFAAVMAFDSLSSLAVGTNFVPDDMLAQIHKGERVIPAADNSRLMAAVAGGGGQGDNHYHFHTPITGGGSDPHKFGRQVVAAAQRELRNGNSFFRPSSFQQ